MTYEEAIKYLIAPVATSTDPSAEYLKQKEAYEFAIKALETGEIYITSEDYNLYMEGYKAGKKDFEPKQGEWIDTGSGQECSQCHEIQYGYDNFRHFCANCGAKMKGGTE